MGLERQPALAPPRSLEVAPPGWLVSRYSSACVRVSEERSVGSRGRRADPRGRAVRRPGFHGGRLRRIQHLAPSRRRVSGLRVAIREARRAGRGVRRSSLAGRQDRRSTAACHRVVVRRWRVLEARSRASRRGWSAGCAGRSRRSRSGRRRGSGEHPPVGAQVLAAERVDVTIDAAQAVAASATPSPFRFATAAW